MFASLIVLHAICFSFVFFDCFLLAADIPCRNPAFEETGHASLCLHFYDLTQCFLLLQVLLWHGPILKYEAMASMASEIDGLFLSKHLMLAGLAGSKLGGCTSQVGTYATTTGGVDSNVSL